MDLRKNKAVVINAGLGQWYPDGSRRLEKSLNFHGWGGDFIKWTKKWPNDNYDKSCGHNAKAAAFEEAIEMGYTHILWVDSSGWAVNDPMPLFDHINHNGYYISQVDTNHNCAECCNDHVLNYFGVTRDDAEKMTGVHTGVFGVNMNSGLAKDFIERFIYSAKKGAFKGDRHKNQTHDERFHVHVQDQSAASLLVNIMGMDMHKPSVFHAYYNPSGEYNKSVVFVMRGM
jgi:hypothetical protein